MSRSLRGQLIPICVYIVMAVSLNLTVGISGELSLGHAGFMSVGAFSGIVASTWLQAAFGLENEVVRLILAMVIGGVFAGIAGVIIGVPVLRLRGDYLAIVTLGVRRDHPQRVQLPCTFPSTPGGCISPLILRLPCLSIRLPMSLLPLQKLHRKKYGFSTALRARRAWTASRRSRWASR